MNRPASWQLSRHPARVGFRPLLGGGIVSCANPITAAASHTIKAVVRGAPTGAESRTLVSSCHSCPNVRPALGKVMYFLRPPSHIRQRCAARACCVRSGSNQIKGCFVSLNAAPNLVIALSPTPAHCAVSSPVLAVAASRLQAWQLCLQLLDARLPCITSYVLESVWGRRLAATLRVQAVLKVEVAAVASSCCRCATPNT